MARFDIIDTVDQSNRTTIQEIEKGTLINSTVTGDLFLVLDISYNETTGYLLTAYNITKHYYGSPIYYSAADINKGFTVFRGLLTLKQ